MRTARFSGHLSCTHAPLPHVPLPHTSPCHTCPFHACPPAKCAPLPHTSPCHAYPLHACLPCTHAPLCEQNDWQTDVKTLPSRNFVCEVVMDMNWYQYECPPLVKEETWTEIEFAQDPPQSNLLVLLSCVHVCFRREQCALYSSKFYDVVEVVRGEENVCGVFWALCSLFCDGRGRYYTRRNTENARDIRWVTRNWKIFRNIDLILIKEGFSASENQSRFYGWRCLQSNQT